MTGAACFPGKNLFTAGLFRLLQAGKVVAFSFYTRQDTFVYFRIHLPAAGQYPEIIAIRMAYHGIAIIVGQVNDPVFARKWPEEGYRKLGIRLFIFYFRFSFRYFQLSFFATGIDHFNGAILIQTVFCGCAAAAFLEALREAGDVVPFAKITVKIDMRYGLQFGTLRR